MANVVYCKFCGRSISAVRSNAGANPSDVSSYMPVMVTWSGTAPASGTKLGQGMVDHYRDCSGRHRWYRRAGAPQWIPTKPSDLGTV